MAFAENNRRTMKIKLNEMKAMIMASGLALVFLICGARGVAAGEVLPGSPDFRPTPEQPVGWRGDGSGRYPAANPPLHWERVAKTIKALRSQVKKPKEGETGQPIPDGVVREWLVLGPIQAPEGFKGGELLPGEAQLSPDENEKAGGLAWKKVKAETAAIDFKSLFGTADAKTGAPPRVAYAFTRLYSPVAARLHMSPGESCTGGISLWLNGKPPQTVMLGARTIELNAGWNSLLIRKGFSVDDQNNRTRSWYVMPVFFGAEGCEVETGNILWTTPMFQRGVGSPVVVGDNIFVTAQICNLICLDKNTGKIRWVRSGTWFDSMTEEEKKAQPEALKEVEALSAQLKEIDASFSSSMPSDGKKLSEKYNLERKIHDLMKGIDTEKYKPCHVGEAGYAPMTPVSDGRNVYVQFANSLVACYDLDGNRKWIALERRDRPPEHGLTASPILVGGKLLAYTGVTLAFDARDGKLLWETPKNGYCQINHAHASFCSLRVGDEDLVMAPDTRLLRAKDGKVLSMSGLPGEFASRLAYGKISTPVVSGGVVYGMMSKVIGASFFILKTGQATGETVSAESVKDIKMDISRYPAYYMNDICASPLIHEGLAYIISGDAVLIVVDAVKGEIVYEKALDLDVFDVAYGDEIRGGCSSSPTLGGKYIYIFGHQGETLVLEPGREFKPVARNRIEQVAGGRQEIMITCPVFDGKRIYVRTTRNLYCIGEPGK